MASNLRLAFLVLTLMTTTGGCYHHAMAGPAVATAGGTRAGGVVTASTGLNGARGGAGIHLGGSLFDRQYSGLLGLEGFRLWRSQSGTGIQPFARAGLGLLELGVDRDQFFAGTLSPRVETGLMWLGQGLSGLTLSVGAEYRFRTEGLSTPIFWLQLGFGAFDFFGSTPTASPTGPEARTEPR